MESHPEEENAPDKACAILLLRAERVGGQGRKVITGVRWAESVKRAESAAVVKIIDKPASVRKIAEENEAEYSVTKQGGIVMNDDNTENRQTVEMCYRWSKTTINPIVDWSDRDVWEFLRHYGCESNPLYQCGYHRIGCIGCPMANRHRYTEFERYPKYKENYIKAFERMINYPGYQGEWKNGEDVFRWWMGEDLSQLRFEDLENLKELQEDYE